MSRRNIAALATGAMLLAGCITCPPVVNDGVVQLPCCASGSANIVRIDTGAAPWQVQVPGLTYSQPVDVSAANVAWAPVGTAAWVRPPPPSTSHAPGTYSYTLPFRVPACSAGRTLSISGNFAADNTASLFLDAPSGPGTVAIASQTTPTHGFQTANIAPFTTSVTSAAPGTYLLRLVVTNEPGTTSDSGLIVSAVIATNCS